MTSLAVLFRVLLICRSWRNTNSVVGKHSVPHRKQKGNYHNRDMQRCELPDMARSHRLSYGISIGAEELPNEAAAKVATSVIWVDVERECNNRISADAHGALEIVAFAVLNQVVNY